MDRFRRELRTSRHFDTRYYKELLAVIDEHVDTKPDITIETCKAVLEGLSKLILQELEQVPDSYFKKKGKQFSEFYREALSSLAKAIEKDPRSICYDSSLLEPFNSLSNLLEAIAPGDAIQRIAKLRSEHGDISHGRSPHKQQLNDTDLAELIVGITDSIAFYLVRKLNEVSIGALRYDDHPDFNESLDEQASLPNGVLYSKALFEQFRKTYEMELTDWQLEQDNTEFEDA